MYWYAGMNRMKCIGLHIAGLIPAYRRTPSLVQFAGAHFLAYFFLAASVIPNSFYLSF